MKATYDKEADAMWIHLKKGKVYKTLKVSDSVLVDVNKKGAPLGIEILFVSSQMPRASIAKTIKPRTSISSVAA